MSFYRKKFFSLALIIVIISLMAGCELLPKSYKLTVQVKDFYSNPISAKVNLLKNGKIIASKTGSIVVFEDLEKGTYLLEGINPEIEKRRVRQSRLQIMM